jgi:hypothetical protein
MSSSKNSKNNLKQFFPSTELTNKKRGKPSLSQEKKPRRKPRRNIFRFRYRRSIC